MVHGNLNELHVLNQLKLVMICIIVIQISIKSTQNLKIQMIKQNKIRWNVIEKQLSIYLFKFQF